MSYALSTFCCLFLDPSLKKWRSGLEASLDLDIMVKLLEYQGGIDFATPEMVFQFLYEDDAFTRFYHKKVNNDSNARATAWIKNDAGGRREVTFKPQMSKVPPFLQNFIGDDIAPLTEVQQYTRVDNTITIHSELSATLFRGFTLVSTGDTILSPVEKGCAIAIKLTLELQTVFWFLRERAETAAETEAKSSFERWLKIARKFCEGKMRIEMEPLLEGEDLFYDAEGLEEEEAISSAELDTDFSNDPPTSLDLRHSGSFWLLQVIWKRFCVTIWNYTNLREVEREFLVLRHSNFFVKAWSAFGFGIATGLTLGLIYNRHLKRKK
eukprot:c30961_g1_i1 orf=97-1068(+)